MQYKITNYAFSDLDRSIVLLGLNELNCFQRQILICRFWENLTIEEIARLLNVSWTLVDETLETSFKELREFCLQHKEFSLAAQKWTA
jgi:DNA-directed RNA polymerase specialized sigma24 family protein